jgi:hypothetical protein
MSWIAPAPETYAGEAVGNGQCVAFVETAAQTPRTAEWKQGALVRDSDVATGTAIATFDPDGTYGNHTDGRSHAAIFVEQQDDGILVGTNGATIRWRSGSSIFATARQSCQ